MVARIYVDSVEIMAPEKDAWMRERECESEPLEKFFPARGEEGPAKKVCASCRVRLECLVFALKTEENQSKRYGVFGGMTPAERKRLQKQLGTGKTS